jgi:hypothetical protein
MSSENENKTEKTRTQLLEELAQVENEFNQDAENQESRIQYGSLLYQAGNFPQAKETLSPILDLPEPSAGILMLVADLEYLHANYAAQEKILKRVLEMDPDDQQLKVQIQIKLLFGYYHSNQFSKSHDLLKGMEGHIQLPIWDMMKSFEDAPPFKVDWRGKSEEIIPFLITDPLPLISVEMQGKQIYALIDTGGDSFYLDNEFADELGIESVARAMGTFAGGKQAEVGFAKAETLKLGDVVIENVPITILPTQRFSKGFAEGKYSIGGILGTNVLKQFLATMDYPNGKLVLRQRNENGKAQLQSEIKDKNYTEIPFFLHQTHHMVAKGSLNDKDDLIFFVDSGLASEAAFIAPIQTLEDTGIPVPETRIPDPEESIGGGGDGLFPVGSFEIERLGLGTLIDSDVTGEYGTLEPDTYWMKGFIQDGLISHNFLREYSWTLDFEEMKYIFVAP